MYSKFQVYSGWFTIFKGYIPFSYYKILAVFCVLYNTPLQLIYFVPSSLYLFTAPILPLLPFPFPTGNLSFILCISESVSSFVTFTSLFFRCYI